MPKSRRSCKQNPGDPHRVNVAYAITENQLVRISEVAYLGQKQTRLSLIKEDGADSSGDAHAAGSAVGGGKPALRFGHL